jgi:Mrp family chromosome partitioning ATPase
VAQWVGQIVIVVRAGKTLQQDVLDALSHLPPDKSIGLVLNQSLSTTPGYYYGYGDAERAAPT